MQYMFLVSSVCNLLYKYAYNAQKILSAYHLSGLLTLLLLSYSGKSKISNNIDDCIRVHFDIFIILTCSVTLHTSYE